MNKLTHMYIHEVRLCNEKAELPGWDSNPRHPAVFLRLYTCGDGVVCTTV